MGYSKRYLGLASMLFGSLSLLVLSLVYGFDLFGEQPLSALSKTSAYPYFALVLIATAGLYHQFGVYVEDVYHTPKTYRRLHATATISLVALAIVPESNITAINVAHWAFAWLFLLSLIASCAVLVKGNKGTKLYTAGLSIAVLLVVLVLLEMVAYFFVAKMPAVSQLLNMLVFGAWLTLLAFPNYMNSKHS